MNNPWYFQLLFAVVPSLIVAIVTAIITVRLSLRRFYAERWWERKADTYSRIVEALHKHRFCCEKSLAIERTFEETHQRPNGEDNFDEQRIEAEAELQRAVDFGAFVMSADVEKIIGRFLQRDIDDPNCIHFSDIIHTDLQHIKKCLGDVKKLAKVDLRL